MDKKKTTNKNEYMRNYRKDKRTHGITLDKKQQKLEDFVLKNRKVSAKDIYMKGIEAYTNEINKTASELEYKLKQAEHEKTSKENEIKELDSKIKNLKDAIKQDKVKEEENKQNFFIDKIKPIWVKFKNETNSENVNDFYNKYTETIKKEYEVANLKPKLKDMEVGEEFTCISKYLTGLIAE